VEDSDGKQRKNDGDQSHDGSFMVFDQQRGRPTEKSVKRNFQVNDGKARRRRDQGRERIIRAAKLRERRPGRDDGAPAFAKNVSGDVKSLILPHEMHRDERLIQADQCDDQE